MNDVALDLCKNIQGAKFAYVQSDEVSILINAYENENSEAYFGGNIQKIVSITASMASVYFSTHSASVFGENRTALFDARVFNIPKHEVMNVFYWRQIDNKRNSIQMLARSLYSHNELHGKGVRELLALCEAKDKDWNLLASKYRRGRCCIKTPSTFKTVNKKTGQEVEVNRGIWTVDENLPDFNKEREYINRFVGEFDVKESTNIVL